jgi:hypothetical protein
MQPTTAFKGVQSLSLEGTLLNWNEVRASLDSQI